MSGPELPYKISFFEEELACIRRITKLIDDLRDTFLLELNKMRLYLNKVHQWNQTVLQNFKQQMQPQEVSVSDFSISNFTYQNILVAADLDPDVDPVQAISQVLIEPFNHVLHTSCL